MTDMLCLRKNLVKQFDLDSTMRMFVKQRMLKGNMRQKWKKYCIGGIGGGGGKSVSTFRAILWLMERFQSTFALYFVSNFYSPITEPSSPITQLGLSIILTWTRFGIWRVKLGNWRAKLGNWRGRVGIWSLKVGNKMESKSSLESFQQPYRSSEWAEFFSTTSPNPTNSVVFFSLLPHVPL